MTEAGADGVLEVVVVVLLVMSLTIDSGGNNIFVVVNNDGPATAIPVVVDTGTAMVGGTTAVAEACVTRVVEDDVVLTVV